VLPNIFPEALTLIDSLKSQSHPLLIISATVAFIVKKVASRIGIDHAIGIDLIMNGNYYSHQIAGIPSYQEGKIQRLKDWIAESDSDFDAIHFYTDSINDLPLCQYADHTYLINPCTQLRNKAEQYKDWVIYNWGQS
jgi:HAD superfamily hydrolase (TIGR01490 family)